jgi:hypothetical protein
MSIDENIIQMVQYVHSCINSNAEIEHVHYLSAKQAQASQDPWVS